MSGVESKTSRTWVDLLPELYHPQEKYSPETKIQAVAAYIVTGSSNKAGKVAGVSGATIRKWKQEAPWWPEVVSTLRKEKQEELDGLITGIMHDSLDLLKGKLANKDEKVTAPQLATVFGILYDKRGIMRGEVGTKSQVSTQQQLEEIKARFNELSKEIQGKVDKKGIGNKQDAEIRIQSASKQAK